MKAIILSAGQGRRLLPYTAERPKCLVPLGGRPLVEWQLRCLYEGGVKEAVIVTGFMATAVDAFAARVNLPELQIRTLYNPFFGVADNLASLYMAADELRDGGIILNGDTLFEPALLAQLLDQATAPVSVSIDRKPHYDDDDMKVRLDGLRLCDIGKNLQGDIDGESIGMLHVSAGGALLLKAEMENVLREPDGYRRWYLSAVDRLAKNAPGSVGAVSIEGYRSAEVDCPADVARAEALVRRLPASLTSGGVTRVSVISA